MKKDVLGQLGVRRASENLGIRQVQKQPKKIKVVSGFMGAFREFGKRAMPVIRRMKQSDYYKDL